MCLRRYIVGSLVGKSFICVALGLLSLVATFLVVAPTANAQMRTTCSKNERTYTVVSGDTLSGIGYRYGVDWPALALRNHIANPDLIYVDQTICIIAHGAAKSVPKQVQNSQTTTSNTPAPAQPTSVTPPAPPQPTAASSGSIADMINAAFGSYGPGAINVATCESGLNPNAYNPSGASGLFQIMPDTWASTLEAGQSPFNAAANIAAAHEIFVRDGFSWSAWTCQP